MTWIRFYWPVVLAAVLVVFYISAVFGRKGERISRFERFRARNQDGPFAIAVLAILLLLLAGSHLTYRRVIEELTATAAKNGADARRMRQANQEWALKYRTLDARDDSLRLAVEEEREFRTLTPLEGTILDKATNEPIEGARITVARHDPSMLKRIRVIAEDVVTDGGGRFRILVPALGPRGTLRTRVRADGYPPEEEWLGSTSSEETLRIFLSR